MLGPRRIPGASNAKKLIHLGALTASIPAMQPIYPLLQTTKRREYAAWTRRRIQDCGCLYIKVAQWVSSRTDIFPEEISAELQVLQSGSDPMHPEDLRATLRDSGFVFDAFDPQPLSTGSVAHVHKAVYKGREVAVKVQRPGIVESLMHDLAIIRGLLRLLSPDPKMVEDVLSSLQDLVEAVQRETDFLEEARHMTRYKTFFETGIVVPSVVVASPRVLIMDLIDAQPFTGTPEMLMDLFFRQFFELGWLHTDMHAGNVGQLADGTPVLFDFGSVMQIPDNIVLGIKALMVAYLNRNTRIMLDYMIEYNILEGTPSEEDQEMLVAFIENVLQYVEVTDINQFAEMMKSIPVTGNPETTFQSEIFMIMRSFTLLEGLCKQLDPDFVIIESVLPLMDRFAADPMMARLKVEDDLRHLWRTFFSG